MVEVNRRVTGHQITVGLSAVNKRNRHQFGLVHVDWTIEHWQEIMWSDELCFQLHRANYRVRTHGTHLRQEVISLISGHCRDARAPS